MIELVKQEDQYGCVPACLAMVLGLEYAAARFLVPAGFQTEGIEESFIAKFLAKKHFLVQYRHKTRKPFAPLHLVVVTDRSQLGSDTNIFTVKHMVVMDKDGRVYDPAGFERPNLDDYPFVWYVLGLTPPPPKADKKDSPH
jgi:hypothetical protein